MEASQGFYGHNRQKDIRSDFGSTQKDTQKPRRLIVKNPRHRVIVKDGYLEIAGDEGLFLAGFRQFDAVYLHKELELSISQVYEIARHMKVYFIDMHGNVLGRFKKYRLETR